MRRTSSLWLLLLAACSASMSSGGFPPGVKTVAILPFENLTTDPTLAQQVNLAVREAVQSRLGLRSAPEATADAVVHGTVTRYEADQPVAYQGTTAGGSNNSVQVTQREVTVVIDIDILDQKTGRSLFTQKGMLAKGEYQPGREAEGRRKALDKLITTIVQGAQSKW